MTIQRAALWQKLASAYDKAGEPIVGDEHDFYSAVSGTYQEVLNGLALSGYEVVEDRSDDYIDGLSVRLPTGETRPIPDPYDDAMEFSAVDAVVDFFLGLPHLKILVFTDEDPRIAIARGMIRRFLHVGFKSIGLPKKSWDYFYSGACPLYETVLVLLDRSDIKVVELHLGDPVDIAALMLRLPSGEKLQVPDPLQRTESKFTRIDIVADWFLQFLRLDPVSPVPPADRLG